MTRHIKRQPSTAQQKRRDAFRTCVNAWHRTQTPDTIRQWSQHAQLHPLPTKSGTTYLPNPYQMFMHYNIYRAYTEVTLLITPPTT